MFEIKGYTKEYYIGYKLVAKEILETTDKKKFGFTNRELEVLKKDIIYKNKIIKKGTEVYTEISPICGRLLGSQKQKFQILANSRNKF